jgi:hypothetical protein
MEEKLVSFNLNNWIKVKIYDEGYQLLADEHNKYCGKIPNWDTHTADYYKRMSDENGYSKFQAWDFIQTFGPYTRLGSMPPYCNQILIDTKDLEDATKSQDKT